MENHIKSRKKAKSESRWNRIERNYKNSLKFGQRNAAANGICSYLMKNTKLFKEHHIKWLSSDASRHCNLDPSLVMNIRHEAVKRSNHKIGSFNREIEPIGARQNGLNDNFNFQCTRFVDKEIDKYKADMESMRPNSLKDILNNNNGGLDCFDFGFSDDFFENVNGEAVDINFNRGADFSLCELLNGGNCHSLHSPDKAVRFEKSIRIIENERKREDDRLSESSVLSYSKTGQISSLLKVEFVPKSISQAAAENMKLCGIAACAPSMSRGDDLAEMKVEIPEVKVVETFGFFPTNKDGGEIVDSLEIKRIDLVAPKSAPQDESTENEDEVTDIEKSTIICELFCEITRANFVLLQKYFLKWYHYTTIEKLSKQRSVGGDQTRLKKIENFLKNIAIERKKSIKKLKALSDAKVRCVTEATRRRDIGIEDPVVMARKYNSKLKIQQDIIELQKVKLDRQERMISELKLSRFSEDTQESQAAVRQELKNVLKTGSQVARSRARCLQIAGNLKDTEDDDAYAALLAKGLTMPKFLVEMQARASERETRHREARERREKLEKDKEEQRLAAEDAKREQDEDAKKQRIEELRRKRREEKLRKIQKENDRLKFIEDMKRVELFRRHRLLHFGFRHFRLLIQIKKRNERLSNEFKCRLIQRNSFLRWHNCVVAIWKERKSRADRCYDRRCLRLVMTLWKKYYLRERSKILVAIDWHDLKLTERVFNFWMCLTAQRRLINELKMKQAEAHYEWQLKWRILDHWRRLPDILRIEFETEKRRQRWRNKIWELLPDYTPNTDDI